MLQKFYKFRTNYWQHLLLKGILLLLFCCAGEHLLAQPTTQIAKLLAGDAEATDYYGWSVSISGDYAIIGAYEEDAGATGAGAAYIFKHTGTSWVQEAKLQASDAEASDRFGYSVAISGDYAIVGASGEDTGGVNVGAAYIFKRTGTSWVQEAKIQASDREVADFFGTSVSISGDYVIVGADGVNIGAISVGAAYIFKRTGTSWIQEAKIQASDAENGDFFGTSVSITGDYVIVGAPYKDTGGQDAGAAYIFKRTGTNWTEEAKIQASDAEDGDFFGKSVSILDDYVIVGAELEDTRAANAGAVYIFKRTGVNWIQEAKIQASDAENGDNFGSSVSISGDYIIIGAYGEDTGGNNAGAAYLFKHTGTNWTQEAKIQASDTENGDIFGSSVSISGNSIIVGAPYEDTGGSQAGAAYLFNILSTSPEINIKGNSNDIADGDITPSISDNTNFGNVLTSKTLTYVIENIGTEDLEVSSINISGVNSADFVVNNVTLPATVNRGITFDITFTPSAIGVRNATVTINSNDADEAVYDFAIQGTGSIPSINNALNFDGINDYVDIGFIPIASTYTYEMWFKANTPNTFLLDGTNVASTVQSYSFIGFGRGGELRFGQRVPASEVGGEEVTTTGMSYTDDQWHHLAAVKTNTQLLLYVDGVLVGNTASTTAINNNVYFYLGQLGSNARRLNGSMDEVRIWNVARSCSEINANMGNELLGNESGLLAYYNFNQGVAGGNNTTVTTLNDLTSNNNDGILTDFTLTSTTSNWVDGSINGVSGTTPSIVEEINVQGNSISIVDGDLVPSTTDNTDFGSVLTSRTVTYTIQNTVAGSNLTVSSIDITGTNATDFVVSNFTNNTTVAGNSATTFDVTFTPSAAGIRTATITINNTDCDEGLYDFTVRGTKIVTTPEINLQGNGTNIISGDITPNTIDNTDFGTTCSAITRTFTIQNIGTGALNLTGTPIVAISRSSDFSITTQPTATVVSPNGSLTFNVTYTPTTSGTQRATISITSNDTDESTYTFVVSGTKLIDTQAPSIRVPMDITANVDAGICTASRVVLGTATATDNCSFIITNDAPTNFPIGITTVTWRATDPSGNTTTATQTVTVISTREIDILGNNISVIDGDITPDTADDTDFGFSILDKTITYTITNTGVDVLTITSITSDNPNFVVSNIPTSIPANGTTTFDVTFTTTIFTQQTATITINNNDCDESVYDFVVQGQKVIPIPPLPVPSVPVNFTATTISTTQINLSWQPITQNITSYRLYRNSVLIATLPVTAVSYQNIDLRPDTFYSFTLIAVNERVGEIKLSSPVSDDAYTFPEAPILISQTDVCGSGSSVVKVSSSGAVYHVYADLVGGSVLVESTNAAITFPSVNQTTTFYVSVVSNNQESARIPVTITVLPSFEATIVGESNRISCESTLLLEANDVENATYTWFRNGVEVGTGQRFEAPFSGNYQVRVVRGVCTILSEKINVELNFVPVAKIQQLNGVRFCDTGTLNALKTNSNANYEWILNGSTIGQGTSISVSESGTYTLQVTQNECQASTQIEVVVSPSPQFPILEATESTICPNTETTISVQNVENGVTYQWFRNGRNLNQTGNSISTSIQGNYQVRAVASQNTSCSSSTSEELEINRSEVIPVYLRISEDRKSLFLEDANFLQNETASVEWYFEGEPNANLGTQTQITPTENGRYSAKITNQNGCVIQTRTLYFSIPEISVITGEEDLKSDLFKIYPNPSKGIFNIHFGTVLLDDIQITVFDGIGRKVYTTTFTKGNQDFTINLENNSSGMYMIHFNQNNSIHTKQIILE